MPLPHAKNQHEQDVEPASVRGLTAPQPPVIRGSEFCVRKRESEPSTPLSVTAVSELRAARLNLSTDRESGTRLRTVLDRALEEAVQAFPRAVRLLEASCRAPDGLLARENLERVFVDGACRLHAAPAGCSLRVCFPRPFPVLVLDVQLYDSLHDRAACHRHRWLALFGLLRLLQRRARQHTVNKRCNAVWTQEEHVKIAAHFEPIVAVNDDRVLAQRLDSVDYDHGHSLHVALSLLLEQINGQVRAFQAQPPQCTKAILCSVTFILSGTDRTSFDAVIQISGSVGIAVRALFSTLRAFS